MSSYYYYNVEDENKPVETVQKPQYGSLYMITHLILSFFAVYLSWRCNGGVFSPIHFLLAFLCPHFYIIWALATRGGCGVFESLPTIRGSTF